MWENVSNSFIVEFRNELPRIPGSTDHRSSSLWPHYLAKNQRWWRPHEVVIPGSQWAENFLGVSWKTSSSVNGSPSSLFSSPETHHTPTSHTYTAHLHHTPTPHTHATHPHHTPTPHTYTTHLHHTPTPHTHATHLHHTPTPHTYITHAVSRWKLRLSPTHKTTTDCTVWYSQ